MKNPLKILANARGLSFEDYFEHIFVFGYELVEGQFLMGAHIREWTNRLEHSDFTSTISARDHSKSTTLRAYIGWRLHQLEEFERNLELFYFSYTVGGAREHLIKAKRYIESNPIMMARFESLSDAASVLDFKDKKTGLRFTATPHGIATFKRGLHGDVIICDDILRDPAHELDMTQITKVTRVVREEILGGIIRPETGVFHLMGTSMSKNDVFWDLKELEEFDWQIYPCWDAEQNPLWPERYSTKFLRKKRRTLGRFAFAKEWEAVPVQTADTYLDVDMVDEAIGPQLPEGVDPMWPVYAAIDIGKKRHPSFYTEFALDLEGRRMIQIHKRWFDGWDYNRQKEYAKERAAHHKGRWKKFWFDNTDRAFESFLEAGDLPPHASPVVFSGSKNRAMATALDIVLTNGQIELRKDIWPKFDKQDRQREQMLAVNSSLQASATKLGHADSFWANAMVAKGLLKKLQRSKKKKKRGGWEALTD